MLVVCGILRRNLVTNAFILGIFHQLTVPAVEILKGARFVMSYFSHIQRPVALHRDSSTSPRILAKYSRNMKLKI